MAGQWPAEVLDSMKYKGEHLEILLTLNRSVGLIRADTRHPSGLTCRCTRRTREPSRFVL